MTILPKSIKLLCVVVLLVLAQCIVQVYAQTMQVPSTQVAQHQHDEFITEVVLLRIVIGTLLANVVLLMTFMIYIGRKLQMLDNVVNRIDDHSGKIEQHTAELVTIAVTSRRNTEMLSAIALRLGIYDETGDEAK